MAKTDGTPDAVDMTDKRVSHLSYDSRVADTDDSDAVHSASFIRADADVATPYILRSVSFGSQQVGKNRVFYM